MIKKTRLFSFVLVFVMIMSTVAYAAPGGNSDLAFDRKVLTRIDSEKVLEHIKYLSEEIGPRFAGTSSEEEAADYIYSMFEEYGYEPQVQEFEYAESEAYLKVDGVEIDAVSPTGTGYQGFDDVSGAIVDCRYGKLDQIPDSVSGKIALIERGALSFSDKAKFAQDKGAIGVILYNDRPGEVYPSMKRPLIINIPVVIISQNDGKDILEKVSTAQVEELNVERVPVYSQNVIAVRAPKGNKPNNGIIYVTAHYDSVKGAPGANDNASGTAMLLEFARILKAYPIDKEVRFIACGAEEVGMEGSYYYADQLTKEEIKRSVGNFNMYMIGTKDEACSILYADTVEGKSNLVVEAAVASGARLGNNIITLRTGSASDHAPFGELGIPAACFTYGDEDWGVGPYYHSPDDTIELNISQDRLETAGEIIGSALYDVLRKATPNLKRGHIKNTYKGIGSNTTEE